MAFRKKPKSNKFIDITTFYPKRIDGKRVKYVSRVDYNDKLLESPFTLSVSESITDYIISVSDDEHMVLSITMETNYIPLLLQLALRDEVIFIFAHTEDEECADLLRGLLTLVDLDNKCEILGNSFDDGFEDLTYIGIDVNHVTEGKIGKTRVQAARAILIETGEYNPVHMKTSIEKAQIVRENIDNISVKIKYNDLQTIYTRKSERSKLKKKVLPISKDEEYERPVQKKEKRETVAESKMRKTKKKSKKSRAETPPRKTIRKPSKTKKIKKKFSAEMKNEYNVAPNSIKGDNYPDLVNPDKGKAGDDAPKIGGWMEGITFYVMGVELDAPDDKLELGTDDWKEKFRAYVKSLILIFHNVEEDAEKMVSDEFIDLWLQAWTHEVYDIRITKNYEALETVGDAAIAYAFLSFLMEKDPLITDEELTNLKHNMLSKASLRQVAWQLGMDKWIRFGKGIKSTSNTAEDVVESFCAVLSTIGTKILVDDKKNEEPERGINLVYKFVKFLYGTVKFTPEMYAGDPKTKLTQVISGLGIPDAEGGAFINKYNQSSTFVHTSTLEWTKLAMDKLRDLGMPQEKSLIVSEKSSSKDAASTKMWGSAIVELGKRGVTMKWLRDIKNSAKFQDIDGKILRKVYRRIHKEYGENVKLVYYLPSGLNTNSGTVAMLIVRVEDGTRNGNPITLGVTVGSDSSTMKKKLILEYSQGS